MEGLGQAVGWGVERRLFRSVEGSHPSESLWPLTQRLLVATQKVKLPSVSQLCSDYTPVVFTSASVCCIFSPLLMCTSDRRSRFPCSRQGRPSGSA